jgi:hypothetical protein
MFLYLDNVQFSISWFTILILTKPREKDKKEKEKEMYKEQKRQEKRKKKNGRDCVGSNSIPGSQTLKERRKEKKKIIITSSGTVELVAVLHLLLL